MGKENFSDQLDEVFKSEPLLATQKVVPIKKNSLHVNEKQISFYIDTTLLKRLKLKALEEGLTLKNIMNIAISEYLR